MRALDTKQTGHVEYMDLYTALTKHIAVKEPLSAEKEKALMERLQGDAAVKSALDAMVRVLRSQHASSMAEAVKKVLDRLDRQLE